jgi:hypothetical protein
MKRIQEASYLLFLLSNTAFGKELALHIEEHNVDLSPISRALCVISFEVFKTPIPFTADLGTYHFLKKQTGSSVLVKGFAPIIQSSYLRKEHVRTVYLNASYDNMDDLKELIKKVAQYTECNYDELINNYRKYLTKHLIQNELHAHEQLIFFKRTNYRDFLMPQLELSLKNNCCDD